VEVLETVFDVDLLNVVSNEDVFVLLWNPENVDVDVRESEGLLDAVTVLDVLPVCEGAALPV